MSEVLGRIKDREESLHENETVNISLAGLQMAL